MTKNQTETTHIARSSSNRRMRAAIAAVVAATATQVPLASAQQSGSSVVSLEEVVVTARRRQEIAQDIPVAVTAMNENFLRDQNIGELRDVGLHVPSLRFSEGGTGVNTPLVTLRGQRPSTAGLTLDAAVPLYFAEVVMTPTEGTNLAMYDLSSVQVLKGPQGTLFGRNSTGGAMILTPQAPGYEFGGYAEVKVGNYDLLQLEGAVDLPVSDTLQFRLAGRKLERDGYQSNIADNPFAEDDYFWDEDSYGVRVSMAWQPTDSLSNNLVVSYDENDAMARVPTPAFFNHSAGLAVIYDLIHNQNGEIDEAFAAQAGRDWKTLEADLNAPDRVENTFLSNITELELNDSVTVKNVFGYREVVTENTTDADGTAVPLFGGITSTTLPYTIDPILRDMDAKQYSEELQLLGDSFGGDLEWLVGAFWMKMEGNEKYPNQIAGANPNYTGPNVPPLSTIAAQGYLQTSPWAEVENEAWSIFGEGTYTFNAEWSLTVGARYTQDDRSLVAKNWAFDTDRSSPQYGTFHCAMRDDNNVYLPDDACFRKENETFDSPTGRLSLNWTPMDEMLVYASVANGYRTGGFNERGTNSFSLQPFDEETVLNYELGLKSDWIIAGMPVRANLAAYRQDYQDIQKTVSGNNPSTGNFETYTINAAEATIDGFEIDLTVAPFDGLTLTAGYSYVDASYDDWPRDVRFPNGEVVTVDYSQANFTYVPENTATGTISYYLPVDAQYGDISVMASVYWQDEMYTNDDGWLWPDLGWAEEDLAGALDTLKTDSYAVWNFRIDWRSIMGSELDAAAFINNAFDEDYVTGGLSVPEDLGIVANTYGPPRIFGASVRYNF
ncbi:TonB-dependent receptor [Haliea sp. E17]|uniref:TonB-dependent receptor n=1 Tax=Haliea sp. E17 TaxID=3401576 RepID=UPI003AAA5E0F